MTCNYPSSNSPCKWEISNKNITITLTNYMIKYSDAIQTVSSNFPTLDSCNEGIEKYKQEYKLINPYCDGKDSTYNAVLIDSGILLHDHVFEKLN